MAKIGHGYGSEWHLLRYLGYHRDTFNNEIGNLISLDEISWLDFKFSNYNQELRHDEEYKGLDFLDMNKYSNVLDIWDKFWPKTGNVPNWDAIGNGLRGSQKEWILVEAKANLEECESNCQAKPASVGGGKELIVEAFRETIKTIGSANRIDPETWLKKYYQYANRLAVLDFLLKNGIQSNLLFINFIGDQNGSRTCPEKVYEWKEKVDQIHNHLGIDEESNLMKKVFHLYLPVHPFVENDS